MRCTRGVPFWDLARASAHAVGEWVSKGYAAESTRLFDLGVKLLRMDTIIRETANDPSTIGRAYSVTVRLGHETETAINRVWREVQCRGLWLRVEGWPIRQLVLGEDLLWHLSRHLGVLGVGLMSLDPPAISAVRKV